jgi:hypothetical protein
VICVGSLLFGRPRGTLTPECAAARSGSRRRRSRRPSTGCGTLCENQCTASPSYVSQSELWIDRDLHTRLDADDGHTYGAGQDEDLRIPSAGLLWYVFVATALCPATGLVYPRVSR